MHALVTSSGNLHVSHLAADAAVLRKVAHFDYNLSLPRRSKDWVSMGHLQTQIMHYFQAFKAGSPPNRCCQLTGRHFC